MARKLTSIEIEQARALKKEMSWNTLARLYGMNRWTLMYQIMPEDKKEVRKAQMRKTNQAAYVRQKEEGGPTRRQRYKQRYGLDWEHIKLIRQNIQKRIASQGQTGNGRK